MRLLCIAVLVTGCTTDPTESSNVVRERYIDRHAETFVLEDRRRTMEALRTVLGEEGYELVVTRQPSRFATDVKTDPMKYTKQCSIHILELVDGKHFVQIMELQRDPKGQVIEKTERVDLTWLVALRADPDRALALMKKANDRADKVPPITRKK